MDSTANDIWCRSLENVLEDGDALQAFLTWARSENAEHPLRFHFSVVAFKEMIGRGDEKSTKLAKEIHKKYLDTERGVCQFVDLNVRELVGQKLANCQKLDESLFDPCLPYIHSYLRKQHAQFIRSDSFIEFLNSSAILNRPSTSSNQPETRIEDCPPSSLMNTPLPNRRNNTQNRKHKDSSNNLLQTQKLTPAILLRSQKERELILGQSSVEKMFQPPLTKYPYVCNATTSKNDSTISSNFSSEANSHHKRTNNYSSSSQQSARPQHQNSHSQRLTTLANRIDGSGSGFRHETEEGRQDFAEALSKRLRELDEKINRSERINEQIQRIDRRATISTRDVVISSEMTIPSYGMAEEDEDLNNYVKQRMVDDSGKPSPSQQQSPAAIPTQKPRRRSPKSCSPEYFPSAAHYQQQPKFNLMSQSYFDPSSVHHQHPMRIAALHAQKFQQYPQVNKTSAGFDLRNTRYCDYDDEDTSGIGSMATTAHFSSTSTNNYSHNQFSGRKDRHPNKSSTTRRSKPTVNPDFSSDFSSLPRQRNSNVNNGQLMKIATKLQMEYQL